MTIDWVGIFITAGLGGIARYELDRYFRRSHEEKVETLLAAQNRHLVVQAHILMNHVDLLQSISDNLEEPHG